jgi:hypothetical protein
MKYVNKRNGYEGYHVIWEIVGDMGHLGGRQSLKCLLFHIFLYFSVSRVFFHIYSQIYSNQFCI